MFFGFHITNKNTVILKLPKSIFENSNLLVKFNWNI